MDSKQLMTSLGFKPNKALGQNFLIDEDVLARIAEAAASGMPDAALPVLEIGAGAGALTAALLARGARVTAVEKDQRLSEVLQRELPAARVVCADFLTLDIARLMEHKPFCAAGNLPYYVTTPICERLLCALPRSAVLMVQAEAAERFFAQPGARVYGPLAAFTQVYYTPERLLPVPPSAFWPQPEVDSAVIRLIRRCDACPDRPEAFLRFLKTAFAMRRKTLYNNLFKDARLPALLQAEGLQAGVRAEAVSPAALGRLFAALEERE